MTLTLHKFGPCWGLSDPSPFCVKLESFLIINDIQYNIGGYDAKTILSKAPKKKVPFVDLENGKRIGDSNFIIQRLAKDLAINMDETLTKEQSAISHACRRMLDENLYFSLLYSRWCEDTAWNVIKPIFFSDMPPVIGGFITGLIRKNVKKVVYGQGTGRHSRDEIYAMANRDLDALSVLLGEDRWFFGASQPTLLDLTCHAYVINIIRPPIENAIKKHTLTLSKLCDHAERLQTQIYNKN